jgi:hypothetical protein
MKPATIVRVAEGIVKPDVPVRNQKSQFRGEGGALKHADATVKEAGETGFRLKKARRTSAGRTIDSHQAAVEADKQKRAPQQADIDRKRASIAYYENKIVEGITNDKERRNTIKNRDRLKHEVEAWDNAAPKELTPEDADKARQLAVKHEKIEQARRHHQDRIARTLVENEQTLLNSQVRLTQKAGILAGLQSRYTAAQELVPVSVDLNRQRAAVWLESGVLTPDEHTKLERRTEADANNIGLQRNRHKIGTEQAGAVMKPVSETEAGKRGEKSEAIKSKSDELLRALGEVRNKPLTDEEKVAYTQAWGLRKVTVEGVEYFEVERGSVLQSVLLVEARKADALKTYRENMDVLKDPRSHDDNQSAEKAFEAANLLVQAEAAEVMTHAMVLETVDSVDAQDAIGAARAMGALDLADQLGLLIEGGKEVGAKVKGVVGEKMGAIWDSLKKNEKLKKALLYVGIGLLALIVLLVAGGTSLMSGALGGKG